MNSLLTLAEGLRAEIESAAAEYRRNARKPHSASTRSLSRAELSESGKRISAAIRAHEQEYERGHAVPPGRDAYGRADMADHHDGVRTAVRQPERGVVVSGA